MTTQVAGERGEGLLRQAGAADGGPQGRLRHQEGAANAFARSSLGRLSLCPVEDVFVEVDALVVPGEQVSQLVSEREPLPGRHRRRGQHDQLDVVRRGGQPVEPTAEVEDGDVGAEHGLHQPDQICVGEPSSLDPRQCGRGEPAALLRPARPFRIDVSSGRHG